MRIVFFTKYFCPHIGGVEKHVLNLSKKMLEKGHDVIVVTEKLYLQQDLSGHQKVSLGHLPGAQANLEDINGIKVIRINVGRDSWFKKFRIWNELLKIRKILISADVIHCHDIFFWYLPFRFLFPTKKVFTTFHGYEGNNLPSRKAMLMHKLAEKLSSGNICVGDFLNKWYGTNPNFVIYGAVDISESQISNLRSQNHISKLKNNNYLTNLSLKILYVGRLEEEAGIMEYLRALKILKERGYNFSLDVLGDGSQKKEAEKFSILNNLDINFKGFVEDVDKYLEKADFIFTSRYLGILESFAKKKFVFAVYNNPIKNDYLEFSPFSKNISINRNYMDLAEEIISVLKNEKDTLEKIEKNYEWVKKQSWNRLAKIYFKLWSKQV
ncbi:glycosyltransferase [Candidatus Microgenomates bacterium]|nr:MAG: glycosyltransferase [Candidatus Microgenomates bacterium]